MDVRVLDYLDDKLQSSADLETLDSLLKNVKDQQDLLKKQASTRQASFFDLYLPSPKLEDARRDHESAERAAQEHAESVQQKAQAFQKEQGDIDRRLLIVTQSEASDAAVEKFEASIERLRKLDVAAGYVELLKEVSRLCSECTAQLGESDDAALEPYRRLQRLVNSLRPLQEAAEGAAPHLHDHIVQQVQKLRGTIQRSFAEDLEKTLKKMNWPKATTTVPLALQTEWSSNISRLLDLQRSDLEARELNAANRSPIEEPPVLLPLEVMVHPLEQRFTFHFSGNKPTNRLDKPEYFLSHTYDLISTYSDFVSSSIQPLLLQHFRGSDLASTPAYIDATTAFITALLPMLRRKLSTFAKQVSSQPQLLSHLVHEVMAFDTSLQEAYSYAPVSASVPWRGLAYYLLDNLAYFQPWLHAERDFALTRYRSIIDSPSAGELDYDSVATDATKPTKAAIRVNDLLETITERYRTLGRLGHKLRFLIDIQIAIFDQFHVRLHSSLEAYMTMTSSLARTVHGVTREDQTELQGVKGLDRLCRVFGSAEYLETAMRDWSDDVFFLDLWEELQFRTNNGGEGSISHNLGSLEEIQQKTSSAVGGDEADGELQGALFDETASAYRRLRVRSEAIIVETLVYNVREALKLYVRVQTWASLSSSTASAGAGAGTTLSSELDPLLRLLAEYLSFLSRTLGKAPLRRVVRQLSHAVENSIWDNVLLRHAFSTAGAAQLSADVGALCTNIDRYAGPGQARAGMRRLLEGVALLALPVRGEIERVRRGVEGEEEGEEEDDDEGAAWEEGDGVTEGKKAMGLFEVERLVFLDNESARAALERLGLDVLSESEARQVLGKRVELGS